MHIFPFILCIQLFFTSCASGINNRSVDKNQAVLYDQDLSDEKAIPALITNGVAEYGKEGLKIFDTGKIVQLDKFYAIAERKIQYIVNFSDDAKAVFRSSQGDFNAFVDVANKKISIATSPVTEVNADFLRSGHDYLVEVYHIYQKNKIRIVDIETGESREVVAVHDGQGGVGKGAVQTGFSAGMQWDHYCFGLKAGSSMIVKRITVKAMKNNVKLLIYGDSISQPEGYFPSKDFSLAWTQMMIHKLKGEAMSSGRGGATIDMVLEYIRNELPFIKTKFVWLPLEPMVVIRKISSKSW